MPAGFHILLQHASSLRNLIPRQRFLILRRKGAGRFVQLPAHWKRLRFKVFDRGAQREFLFTNDA